MLISNDITQSLYMLYDVLAFYNLSSITSGSMLESMMMLFAKKLTIFVHAYRNYSSPNLALFVVLCNSDNGVDLHLHRMHILVSSLLS